MTHLQQAIEDAIEGGYQLVEWKENIPYQDLLSRDFWVAVVKARGMKRGGRPANPAELMCDLMRHLAEQKGDIESYFASLN